MAKRKNTTRKKNAQAVPAEETTGTSSKVEVFLTGEFTTIDVYIEGREIPLREINDTEYYKLYTSFDIINPLDVHVRLKGWFIMDWSFAVKVNDQEVLSEEGQFGIKGFVTFTNQVTIEP